MNWKEYLSVLKADVASGILILGLCYPWWEVCPDFLEEASTYTSWNGALRVYNFAEKWLGIKIKDNGGFERDYRQMYYKARKE